MTLNSKSFKDGQTSLGIFYPTGYVLSVFQNGVAANGAAVALSRAGFTPDDLVPATGMDVLALAQELSAFHGLLNAIERFLSEHLGDEAYAAGQIVELADAGSSFLAVYAPGEAATTRVVETARAFEPVVMRKFDRFTFTDLR
jgi:hypothetical protein